MVSVIVVGAIALILGLGIVDHFGNSLKEWHRDGSSVEDGYVKHTVKQGSGSFMVGLGWLLTFGGGFFLFIGFAVLVCG